MTHRRRVIDVLVGLALVVSAIAYLRDPPWLGSMTFGLREWDEDAGVRFRWTTGHATFFVPSDARGMTLSLRSVYPSDPRGPVTVAITVDDRPLSAVTLDDPTMWTRTVLPLPRRSTGRRVRRVDLRVNRTVGEGNFGVQLGDIVLDHGPRPRGSPD